MSKRERDEKKDDVGVKMNEELDFVEIREFQESE